MKPKLLVTGAAGGMGQACARLLGTTRELILTDVAAEPLERFAEQLRDEGYSVAATRAGDLADAGLVADLVSRLDKGAPFTLVHAAGLSPSMADWRKIMHVNLLATETLLKAVEEFLSPGTVAILVASTAAHVMPVIPDVHALLDRPLADGMLDRLEPIVQAMAAQAGPAGAPGIGYSLSKQAVVRMCETRAAAWGKAGARIVSISPGLILTPMGRKEVAETPGAAEMRDAAPAGRPGTALDIALAARFLASSEASFITGTDLRVDGGSIGAMRQGFQ